jgi:hypothetical protein
VVLSKEPRFFGEAVSAKRDSESSLSAARDPNRIYMSLNRFLHEGSVGENLRFFAFKPFLIEGGLLREPWVHLTLKTQQCHSSVFAMKSFCSLGETIKNTRFVLKSINTNELDKQYIMKELQDMQSVLITQQLTNTSTSRTSDSANKLHTTLEIGGFAHTTSKPIDTIVFSDDVTIKLFASPINKARGHVRCWYCRTIIPQDWCPLGIPIKYIEKTKQFVTEGIVCSFNCMCGYVQENHNFRYKDSGHLIYMLYRRIFNCHVPTIDILPSPSWKLLKEYGGNMDIDEYRKAIQYLDYKSLNQTWFISALELFTEASTNPVLVPINPSISI